MKLHSRSGKLSLLLNKSTCSHIHNNAIITLLIGHPVAHSVSFRMFAIYAASCGFSRYFHTLIDVPSSKDLPKVLDAMRYLDIRGANVTMPYKRTVLPLLDVVEPDAVAMDAVNTIINVSGKLIGCNTDGIGALNALTNTLGNLNKKGMCLLFGAGGAARSIAHVLSTSGMKLTIINRTIKKGISLTNSLEIFPESNPEFYSLLEFHADKSLRERLLKGASLIVNATSLGMNPSVNDSIIEPFELANLDLNHASAFDVVFNPPNTKFLALTAGCGANAIGGIEMMLMQGVEAFGRWTGSKPDNSTIALARSKLFVET